MIKLLSKTQKEKTNKKKKDQKKLSETYQNLSEEGNDKRQN